MPCIEERKRCELKSHLWQQMTERALNQIKNQHSKEIRSFSTYKECYDNLGFKVKELGSEIDEEVSFPKSKCFSFSYKMSNF